MERDREIAQAHWLALPLAHADESWCALDAAYGDARRAYHGFNHIADLLEKLDKRKALATRPDLVAAAIFWHDAVYSTQGPNGASRPDAENVADSVALFRKHARFSPEDIEAVADMISATAHHSVARAEREFYPGYSADLDLFLDLDLSSLAAPWPVFRSNLANIRYEFSWLPAATFYRGRVRALESFVREDARLFRRDENAREWEAAARENVARAIDDLRGEIARLA